MEEEKSTTEKNQKKEKEQNAENKISKDMIIAEIVAKFPYLAEYIMDYGVHCVGCGIASFETLEEGFTAHGMTSENVDAIIEELNNVIEETEKGSPQ
jgi:hybrid cluster-associated redox disulfide protein